MLKRIQYQPGNGTNYDLLYGPVEDNGYLLVWLNRGGSGGSAFRFNGSLGYIAGGYLMEKMDLPSHLMGDVHALCAFLNAQGHTAEVDGDFDENGQYVRPNVLSMGGAK